MKQFIISLLVITTTALADSSLPLSFWQNITPQLLLQRSRLPKEHGRFFKEYGAISTEQMLEVYEYLQRPELYQTDLESLEKELQRNAETTNSQIPPLIFEVRKNLLYAYHILIAYDITNRGETELAFLGGLEYLRRVRFTQKLLSPDPIFQEILYRSENTSSRNTMHQLFQTLANAPTEVAWQFITNGMDISHGYNKTHLEHLLNVMNTHRTFYKPVEIEHLFIVAKLTIDHLYKYAATSTLPAKLHKSIFIIAHSMQEYVRQNPFMFRYFENILVREEKWLDSDKNKADKNMLVINAANEIQNLIKSFIKQKDRISIDLTFQETVLRLHKTTHVTAEKQGNVVSLSSVQKTDLYSFEVLKGGIDSSKAIQLLFQTLIEDPRVLGFYFDDALKIPKNVDISTFQTTTRNNKDRILQRPSSVALSCQSIF